MTALCLVLLAALAGEPAPAAATPPSALRPGVLVDLRALAADHGQARAEVQRVRPALRGELLDGRWSYLVQAELAGEAPSLLDAAVRWRVAGPLSIQAGRFLVPYTRAQATPVPRLQYHGFAPSTGAERHGRDAGVQAGLAAGLAAFHAGVFQGALGEAGAGPLVFGRASVDVVGRVPLDEGQAAVEPEGEDGLSVGLGARVGSDLRAGDGALMDSAGAAADLAARLGPARVQAEAYVRRWADGAVHGGGYVQASVAPAPRVELGARGDLWRAEASAWTAQALGAYYANGHHARLSLQLETGRAGDAEARYAAALQSQVWM